jgi:hypothetical protein
MHPLSVRREAVRLVSSGRSINAVSKQLNVSRAAIREWVHRPDALEPRPGSECPAPARPTPEYAALFGFYLGDGCVSQLARTCSLRICCDAAWPGIIADVRRLTAAVHPNRPVFEVKAPGCVVVQSSWKHWPCLFPQHGPGRKHNRRIELEPWQAAIVEEHPGRFLRGLFHSDGCRVTNWTERVVAGERKRYEYPRYFFSNRSEDILRLCEWAVDLLAVEHRRSNAWSISVARRASVAVLDQHVGPKS